MSHWMQKFTSSGTGTKGTPPKVPSSDATRAFQEGQEWTKLNGKCKGDVGTLIRWPHENGKAEFCPTGSTPVLGGGYASTPCDFVSTHEVRLHCCNVDGKLQ